MKSQAWAVAVRVGDRRAVAALAGAQVIGKIPTTLSTMQELAKGNIPPFRIGVPGTIGVANDEDIVHDMPFNRSIPATVAQIFGPFFVVGYSPDFRSLTPLEMEQALNALAPELSQAAFQSYSPTRKGSCGLRTGNNIE